MTDNAPGASARRMYERRARREHERIEAALAADTAWRAQARADHPVLGRVVTLLTPKPVVGPESRATRAWGEGASGEERVGAVLDACSGVLCLHDRRVPGSKANIDHIVVAPSGIFVVDAKRYRGRVEKRDVGGWLRTDHRLYVAGRDRTELAESMARQVAVVQAAVNEQVPVRAVLCFVGAEWARFARPLEVRGVTVTWPKRLAEVVGGPGPLVPARIDSIGKALSRALLPA